VSAENVERARHGFEAVVSGDLEAVREFLDPAVQWHGGDPTFEGACHTSDEVIEFIRRAREHGAVGELVDVIDCGERVVVVIRPPGAAEADLRANLTTFRDGKAIEMVAYDSPEAALAAAGSSGEGGIRTRDGA
jgi:ketosteroid isomerase-like protein